MVTGDRTIISFYGDIRFKIRFRKPVETEGFGQYCDKPALVSLVVHTYHVSLQLGEGKDAA